MPPRRRRNPLYDWRTRARDRRQGRYDGGRSLPAPDLVEELIDGRSSNPLMANPYTQTIVREGLDRVELVRQKWASDVVDQRARQSIIRARIYQRQQAVRRREDDVATAMKPLTADELQPRNPYEQRRPDIVPPRRAVMRARRIGKAEAARSAAVLAEDEERARYNDVEVEIDEVKARYSEEAWREYDLVCERIAEYWAAVIRHHEFGRAVGPLLEGREPDMTMPDWVMPRTGPPVPSQEGPS